jgi:hypothetical protein
MADPIGCVLSILHRGDVFPGLFVTMIDSTAQNSGKRKGGRNVRDDTMVASELFETAKNLTHEVNDGHD